MICPYDQAQCGHPGCLFVGAAIFDVECYKNYRESMVEYTACIIKPDAFPKYAGEILSRLLGEDFNIVLAGTVNLSEADVAAVYDQHVGADYYEKHKTFMMSGPVFAMVLERNEAIKYLRYVMGPTKIDARHTGELRYEFGDPENITRNVIHGSDTLVRSFYEINLIRKWLIK